MTASADAEIAFDIRPCPNPTPAADRAQVLESPGFGQVFTDHMITIRWSAELGWHDARLEPYGPLRLDPSASVFHYGQEIFESLKAYRQNSGRIVTFRPEANAARLNRSAQRLAMPELPQSAFVRAIELLVKQDRAWVPSAKDHSLYVRPFMIATEPRLREDRPSSTYLFMIIASPVGPYFPRGVRPVAVRLAEGYSRAGIGGTGEAKCGSNYGGTFAGQQQAIENGCDQVVWLDSIERRWVEELGGMNLMFVYGTGAKARLMTPQLTGTFLPGIIRDSLLKLSPDLGIPAAEDRISVEEWQTKSESGEISETFACGTAAVITPVGKVKSATTEWTIGNALPGPVTMQLREHLINIQYGNASDPYGWIHEIC
jgi:branched-chain amino acid aminotransferase